jgi:hypothetical protein
MILWDIDTGERVRTFEGHDRGLACIEFKVREFSSYSFGQLNVQLGRFNCIGFKRLQDQDLVCIDRRMPAHAGGA